ncbi:VOC family protein [Jeotgalibacillus malaysiensis]|uniref:VOC family protein n=1 Tax=Jeotgalibacillus malaysiensis TaxID=1508404 RepID=UPI00384D43B2
MFKVGSVFIPVTNLERSAKWYETHFHVKPIEQWEGGAGYYFPDSAVQLGLIEVRSSQPSSFTDRQGGQNTYFNLIANDISSVHTQLTENGLHVSEIRDFGGMNYFDCEDPDGNILSIIEEVPGSPFHSDQVDKLPKAE